MISLAQTMASYPAYVSDLEHQKLNAHIFPGHVIETYFVSDPNKGLRRKQMTRIWKVERQLGNGGSGEVRLEVRTDEQAEEKEEKDRRRAMKRIWTGSSDLRKGVERELNALLMFSKGIYKEAAVFVEFKGWFEENDSVYLAMEYVQHGDLEDHIPPKGEPINEREIREIASQILQGLEYMHQEGFIHRDLKPKNVLVCRKRPRWWIKLADFGLSKHCTPDTAYRTTTGTQAYMAPEMLNCVPGMDPQGFEYTTKIDLWSLGCIIYRLASGVVPFPLGPSLYKYCNGLLEFPPHPLALSLIGATFVEYLLEPRPTSRPTALEARSHLWMSMPNISPYDSQHPENSNQLSSYTEVYDTVTHAALRSRTSVFQPTFPDNSMGERRHDVPSSNAGVVNHSSGSFESRNEQMSPTRILTDAEICSSNIAEVAIAEVAAAEVAIADLYEHCNVGEQSLVLPIIKPISAAYPNTPDSFNENVLSGNCSGIMSVEDAEEMFKSERKEYWSHDKNPRRAQNRINKHISRWKKSNNLETAEDYYKLACNIRNRRIGQMPQRRGRRGRQKSSK